MTSARDVLELSRAMLAGQAGYVIVLYAFIDESGTHDGSPVLTVAAYVGRPSKWNEFTKLWNRRKFPIRVYHAADAQNLYGEFSGWTAERRDALVAKLLPTLTEIELDGFIFGTQLFALDEAIRNHPGLRIYRDPPTAYGAAFYWLTIKVLESYSAVGNSERIAFFHEQNNFAAHASSSFEWAKLRNPDRAMTLKFGSKDDYVPLQAADVLAYEANKRYRDWNKPPRRSWQALEAAGRIHSWYWGKNQIPAMLAQIETAERIIANRGLEALAGQPISERLAQKISQLRRRVTNHEDSA